MTEANITELDLCAAWTQLPRSLSLKTIDGRAVEIIHLGTWTHGFGPDFRDSMICIDGTDFQTGSVELHLRTRGWMDHGHHLDPNYNNVILHVVTQADPIETRRQDGKVVPVIVLIADVHSPSHRTEDWSLVGGEVCAEHLAQSSPSVLVDALEKLGDERMSARSAQLEAHLTRVPPDQVLFEAVLDALGFTANRDPMRAVAEHLSWPILSTALALTDDPYCTAAAALLGVAGFLPMSDAEFAQTGLPADHHAVLVDKWRQLSVRLAVSSLPPTRWQLTRVRPTNHPVRRLVQAAALVTHGKAGLTAALLEPIRDGQDPTSAMIGIVAGLSAPSLGEDRARAIVTNILVPFAFALASHSGDTHLAERAGELWGSLRPGESNERTRRAIRQVSGKVGLKRLGGRAHQGLLHLDQALCAPRRCYQCPIGRLVVMMPTP